MADSLRYGRGWGGREFLMEGRGSGLREHRCKALATFFYCPSLTQRKTRRARTGYQDMNLSSPAYVAGLKAGVACVLQQQTQPSQHIYSQQATPVLAPPQGQYLAPMQAPPQLQLPMYQASQTSPHYLPTTTQQLVPFAPAQHLDTGSPWQKMTDAVTAGVRDRVPQERRGKPSLN